MRQAIQRVAHRLGVHISRYPLRSDQTDFDQDLTALITRLNVNCVLDVGARFGEFGAKLRKLGYRGRIISFEPVASNFEKLARRAAGDRDWATHSFALGGVDEERPIHVMAGSDFSSFLAPSSLGKDLFPDGLAVRSLESVHVRRLDAILDECVAGIDNPSVFLKTDTQGFDLDVIESAGTRVNEIRALHAEIAVRPLYEGVGDFAQSMQRLYALGFCVVSFAPVFRDSARRVGEFDCLAERPLAD